jgi:5-methylcytosine-specific restriction endonuclease McrA
MRRACPKCGRIEPCAAHPRRGGTRPPSHFRFARAVKARDGHQCQHCGSTRQLEAHHLTPISAGGSDDPANGITLCKGCHRAVVHVA